MKTPEIIKAIYKHPDDKGIRWPVWLFCAIGLGLIYYAICHNVTARVLE